MRYEESFFESFNEKLITLLRNYKVKYAVVGDDKIMSRKISFSLFIDEPFYSDIKKATRNQAIVSVTFTGSELHDAKWLKMRPYINRVHIINMDNAFTLRCVYNNESGIRKAKHREQKDVLQINTDIKWGAKNFFYAADYGYSEVFINLAAKELIHRNNLSGVLVKPVLDRKGNPCNNTFQLCAPESLGYEAIALGYGEKATACPICGEKRFIYDGTYQLHIKNGFLNKEMDLYVTSKIFGEGIAESLFIVSQKFFRLIKDNKMDTGIDFSPVNEV